MDRDVIDPLALDRGLPIHQASALLGVPAPTLRSWERRYGLPTTRRSSGGHRRYSETELHQLRLMRDEVAHGRRAADAALRVRMLLSGEDVGAPWIAELLDVSRATRPLEVQDVLDRADAELGLAATIDEVLLPAMRQVGNWWASGQCDVGQEHLTTEAVRRWLSGKLRVAATPTGPGVVLACGPRDQHTVGLEALAALIAPHGLQSYLIGARTPPQALLSCLKRTAAAGAVIVSHLPSNRRATVDALTLLSATGRPLFYAGNAFLFAGARKGVPGTYLGENLTEAAEVVIGALTT
jgi:methanogenic corrinoid protein MtbC1